MRRTLLLTIAAGLLAVRAARAETALTTFTLQHAWYPTMEYASFYLGQGRGTFAEEGIDLKFQPWKLGVNGVEQVAEGRADIGVDDAVNFLMAVDRGEDLVAIFAFMQETPLCLVSLRHELGGIEDLVGKKVATVTGFEYLLTYLRQKFPKYKDKIEFVELDDNLGALQDGKVDAAIFFETAQPPLLKLRGHPLHVLRYRDIGYDVYSHILFVRRDFYEKNRPALARFAKALHRSMSEKFADPEGTVDFFVKTIPHTEYAEGPFANEAEYRRYQAASLRLLHYYMSKGVGKNFGLMNRHRWRAMIKNLKRLGVLENDIDADAVFTNKLLRGIYVSARGD